MDSRYRLDIPDTEIIINGDHTTFHKNGRVMKQWSVKNGKPHGDFKSFYRDGNVAFECSYKDGKRHGEFKKWLEDELYSDEYDERWFLYPDDEAYYDDEPYLTDEEIKEKVRIAREVRLMTEDEDRDGTEEKFVSSLKIHCFYVDGLISGEYREWNPDGSIRVECRYVDGLISGEYREWIKKDTPKILCSYLNVKIHGLYREWDDAKNLSKSQSDFINYTERNYQHGVLNGEHKTVTAYGVVKIQEYKDGVLHGKYTETWSDGTPKKIGNYNGGKLHGEYKEWTDRGVLIKHANYVDNTCHGEYREWDVDGRLKVIRNYNYGIPHGLFKEWYNEILIREYNYNQGKLDGLCKDWYHNGNPDTWVMYKNGRYNGYYREWRIDGTPYSETYYVSSKRCGEHKEFSENGEMAVSWWINGRRVTKNQLSLLTRLVNNSRHKIKIASCFGLSLPSFRRCVQSLRSREFCEWWYNPENHGGKRVKSQLAGWLKTNI
jgi:antitoxin component YwqK of YwqJK toxin-antitoxin module